MPTEGAGREVATTPMAKIPVRGLSNIRFAAARPPPPSRLARMGHSIEAPLTLGEVTTTTQRVELRNSRCPRRGECRLASGPSIAGPGRRAYNSGPPCHTPPGGEPIRDPQTPTATDSALDRSCSWGVPRPWPETSTSSACAPGHTRPVTDPWPCGTALVTSSLASNPASPSTSSRDATAPHLPPRVSGIARDSPVGQ